MIDPLLDYYERELEFIRGEASEFARRYPKIAGRLRLKNAETLEDPHVSRLIEAFALLCARLRIKMEDEFPEICLALLQALYPQYVAPVPPIAICQLSLTDKAIDIPTGRTHYRGEMLESEEIGGVRCMFRLCYDTQLLPLSIESAEYLESPLPFPVEASWKNDVQAAVRIRMTSQSEKLPLKDMQFDYLRFYLGGSNVLGNTLYAALMRDALGVTLYQPKNPSGVSLPSSTIASAGFADRQGLIDDDPRTIKAYRLLWEFFAAPEKFRFVDFQLSKCWTTAVGESQVDLVVLLRRSHPELRALRSDTMRLGCSPVINLFEQVADSTRLTANQTEYRIIADARKPRGVEVISVEQVTASSPGGQEKVVFKPFFMPSHRLDMESPERYWHSTRRRRLAEDNEGDRGSEVYLTLVDRASAPQPLDEWTMHVTTICCNRDMVSRLPFGGGAPSLVLQNAGGAVTVELLTPPTMTLRPLDSDEYYWRIISHLNLNHLTLLDNENGAEALREILRLYNPNDSEETKRAIQSIESVQYKRAVGRIPSSVGAGFCRGVEILVRVDEERLVGMGPYMFAAVLDRFFSLFSTINSFTRLTVHTLTGGEPLYAGPARAGDRILL